MFEPLLSTLTAPDLMLYSGEAPPLSSLLVGRMFYVMGGIALLAALGFPLLRALGLLIGYVRWLVSQAPRMWTRSAALGDSLEARPLSLTGLSPALARLAGQTRTLALELRRRSEEARHWPDDAAELETVRGSWWRSALTDSVDFSPLMNTRREVYDWLQSAERLGARDRETLTGLGVDVDVVREALLARHGVAEQIRALAGLLWTIDDRLLEATNHGYRATANPGSRSTAAGSGPGSLVRLPCFAAPTGEHDEAQDPEPDELEARARQRRFAELLGVHGTGLSRLAGSYARDRAEREDIEQDIALALWQALPRFRGESSIQTFAYRVARYCCYRYVRRRERMPIDADALAELGDPETFERKLLEADARAQVERALTELPHSLESTVHLHLSGLSYAEIAAHLGISERNVSVRLTRARHRLRAELAVA